MKIGIVGGTGDIGEGMAMRLAPRHEIFIGSRETEKACKASECTREELSLKGVTCTCEGVTNQEAVDRSELVILAIPYAHVQGTLRGLSRFEGKIVVSPVNPMEKKDFFAFTPPPEGGAGLLIRTLLPPSARLCVAFNTIAANRWKAYDEVLTYAVPVCSDDSEAKKVVMDLVNGTSQLKAYDAGPLAVSPIVESITPLLLNVARYNRMRDVGIQFI